jgi:hypothetical protein
MSRPRGFAPWNPRADKTALVEAISDLLIEYGDQLPLTLRQLFYLLVVRSLVEKTERAYQSLCSDTVARARRAQMLPMDAFRDDGFSAEPPAGWVSAESFLHNVHRWAEDFTLDRQRGQSIKLALWCETQGMAPQLRRVADEFSVPVLSSGGFDSITAKHEQARKLGGYHVLHIGDHDPSGVTLYGSLDEDVRAFAEYYGEEITFERLAVTPDQVQLYGLPTAPVKNAAHSHAHSFTGETVQAEALDPRDLAGIVREAIEAHFDMGEYDRVVEREVGERARLLERLKS